MKELKFVLIIVSIYVISVSLSYFLGSKFGSTEKIIYKDVPIIKVDTIKIVQEKITPAKISKEEPPIISDSLSLEQYFENGFVKYVARPFKKDSLLSYNTEWSYNIIKTRDVFVDTIKIEKYKKDFGFSCLTGTIGFASGVAVFGGLLFFILTR